MAPPDGCHQSRRHHLAAASEAGAHDGQQDGADHQRQVEVGRVGGGPLGADGQRRAEPQAGHQGRHTACGAGRGTRLSVAYCSRSGAHGTIVSGFHCRVYDPGGFFDKLIYWIHEPPDPL